MATLQIASVEKSYGMLKVLHGITLDITDGEFIVLVGPSGCGKSTLLRMIAGLEQITGGDIFIDGVNMNWEAPKDRGIAMVFQNYALYPHMKVRENMAFALELAKRKPEEIRTRVETAASMLGLEPYLERYPRELSGGQRQRVAMGRALVRDPKVFLFDEPLSNLDAKLRVQMRTEIRELQQRLKTTTVYVTHDQVEAMTMADRIVVMNGGRVEQVGSPLEVYDSPANRFVASFIGSPSMNFIEGTYLEEGQEPRFEVAPGLTFDVPKVVFEKTGPGAGTLGIRPEGLTLSEGSSFKAQVGVVEPTGADTLLHCSFEGNPLAVVTKDRVSLTPGDTIGLAINKRYAAWFDANGLNRSIQ